MSYQQNTDQTLSARTDRSSADNKTGTIQTGHAGSLRSGAAGHGFLCFSMLLVLLCCCTGQAAAQGVSLAGACPAACGVSLRITDAQVTEASDGVLVKVDWTIGQPKPEIKLTSLQVRASADLGIDRVERNVAVGLEQRTVTIKLSRLREFDVRDIKTLQVKVFAFANPLPGIPVTGITSRKIVSSGRDAAVDVTWNDPGPLPCTATKFIVNVSALNEKGDRLTGSFDTGLNARRALVGLSGALNRKGLNSPEANIKTENTALGCEVLQTFTPANFTAPFGSATGSISPEAAKVTLSQVSIQEEGSGRVDTRAEWSVVEPTGFKAFGFDVKFEITNTNGTVAVQTQVIGGNKRSAIGPQGLAADTRSLTVTITATFRDNANTTVITREDKKTQAFTRKQVPTTSVAAKTSVVTTPQSPALPPDVGLEITNVNLSSGRAGHRLVAGWRVNAPAGITVASFTVEARLAASQGTLTRDLVVAGNQQQAVFAFTLKEAGDRVGRAQVKVIANCRRADGSTFQRTVTRNSN